MNAQAPVLDGEVIEAPTDVMVLASANPVQLLSDPERFDAFYLKCAEMVRAHVPDLTTDRGRKAIASLARKVVTTKTTLDDAGKKLTEEKRQEINVVDAARRNIREKLDALRDEARKPLTDWEAAEEERQNTVKATIEDLRAAGVVSLDDTTETVGARLLRIEAVEIAADVFQEFEPIARATQEATVAALNSAIARLTKEAADRAELERLRAADAKREQEEAAERERKAKAEAEAAAAQAAARAEEQRKADEAARAQREAETRERLVKEAAAKAEAEAAAKAKAEQEAKDKTHAEALAAEKRRADDAEASRKAEAERAAKAAADAKAQADKDAAEKAAREANIAHRSKILTAAKLAVMEHGSVTEDVARAVVQAIAARLIPNVAITY